MTHADPIAPSNNSAASFTQRLLGRSFPRILVVVGIVLHLFGFFAFSLISDTHKNRQIPKPAISLYNAESLGIVLEEQAALLDSEPLFLPTRWNQSLKAKQSATARNPILASGMLDAQIAMSANEVTAPPASIDSIEHAHLNRQRLITEGFGSAPLQTTPLLSRMAYLIIRDSKKGEITYESTLTLEDPAQDISGELWLPLRATMHYTTTGLLGEPLLLESTGAIERDDILLNAFKKSLTSLSLPPGYYFIQIGL